MPVTKQVFQGGLYEGQRGKALTVAAPSEGDVQKNICWFLDLRDVVYAVTDAKTVKTVNGARQCVRPEGWPDITALLPVSGRLWAIEVKSERGALREAQKDMLALIEASGGLVTVARDYLEVRRVLDDHLAQYETSVLDACMDVVKRLKRVFAEHAFARKQKSKRRKIDKRNEGQLIFEPIPECV